jgi:hypothetical protein
VGAASGLTRRLPGSLTPMMPPRRGLGWFGIDAACVLMFCAVGMLLRKATSAGVAGSFVVVASAVTALLLLGWRALARFTRRAEPSKRQA